MKVKEKLKRFTTVYDELKLKTKDNITLQRTKSKSVANASNLPKQTEIPNQGKKQAKRVRRKNRARIAKMRSADVAERRKINTSVLLQNIEQEVRRNETTIIEDDDHVSDKENNDTSSTAVDKFPSVDVEYDIDNAEFTSNYIEQCSENNNQPYLLICFIFELSAFNW